MNIKLSNLCMLFELHNIGGYIIPHSDEYQNEYTPDCSKRLEYMTGFTGSNGIAIITKDKQYFWTDGRYKLQAQREIPEFVMCDRDFGVVNDDLVAINIGYNPMLFTSAQIEAFSKSLTLIPITQDLVDSIWKDKPVLPSTNAYLYPIQYSGMDATSKLQIVRQNFATKAKYALITELESICWLLNIRGVDTESVPVILGYLILSADEVIVFTDLSKISASIISELKFVQFKPCNEIFTTLKSLNETLLIDPTSCSVGLQSLIANKIEGINPCALPKACKNNIEIECATQGHIKDAVALCEGLSWVQNNRGITEHEVSLKLTELRSSQEGYVADSFPTIAGFRENGAIIHYRAPKNGSKTISGDGMLLIDSGAHYWGCTTDVTRVLVFGTPTDEQKRRYTEVLKGHIALASVKFPVGTFGCNIDILARQYLWDETLDYAHSTGHGVGNMLSVHEAPGYIGQAKTQVQLQEGMIISNEPGFYKEGEFGIRIENLMYVKKSSKEGFLEFAMLTLVPYARDLIDITMLSEKEIKYLKGYYQKIKAHVLPSLKGDAKIWCEYEMELGPK